MVVPAALDRDEVTASEAPESPTATQSAPGTGPDEAPATGPAGGPWSRLRLVPLALLVAAAGMGGWWAGDRLAGEGVGGADDPQQVREQLMATAEQFMLRINHYGPDDLEDGSTMPGYRDQVAELLTPRFAGDFEENVPIAEQTVAQAGVARTAEVFATGVSDVDADSAEVLVAGRIEQSVPGDDGRVASDPVPFRMVVTLRLVEGEWLVDDYDPASSAGQDEVE